jgi:hypothetical protein
MTGAGVLETIARVDLEALWEEVGRRYEPGALEVLVRSEPEWSGAVDRAEAEVGGLYEALREADRTLARWREAVGELRQLWGRAGSRVASAEGPLSDVA